MAIGKGESITFVLTIHNSKRSVFKGYLLIIYMKYRSEPSAGAGTGKLNDLIKLKYTS